jgi:hypothetical protein
MIWECNIILKDERTHAENEPFHYYLMKAIRFKKLSIPIS